MYTFRKEERLCSKVLIKKLFDQGAAISVAPFRSLWMETSFEAKVPLQIVISVPKKRFKRAVDRNTIKRQIREAYRLNKTSLWETLSFQQKQCVILFIYSQNNRYNFRDLESKIILTLQQIKNKIVVSNIPE
jgi:ribonuclease P protein component